MTRSHRRWHLWVWAAVGPLAAMGLILGLWSRPTLESGKSASRGATSAQTNSVEAAP